MRMTRHAIRPMRPSEIALLAVTGEKISDEERGRLSPSMLALLAVGGHLELKQIERYRLPISTLFALAAARMITLSRRERDRLSASRLAQLVVGGQVLIGPEEFKRLPRPMRAFVSAHAAKNERRITMAGES
jgi:hypothetical protein